MPKSIWAKVLASTIITLHTSFVLAQNLTASAPGGNSTLLSNATKLGNGTKPAGNSTKPANATANGGKKPIPKPSAETIEGWRLVWALIYFWIAMLLFTMGVVFVVAIFRYIRTVSSLGHGDQSFFAIPYKPWGLFKKHFLDAPLFRKRHHRAFHLTRRIDMGCLPNRVQTFMVTGYVATVIFLTVYNVDFNRPRAKVLTSLTKRTGLMAITNMIPLFIFAGRNNPIIWWTGVSFDTFNLYHRWLGRIVCLESIAHFIVYIIRKVEAGGWKVYGDALHKIPFIRFGTIALGAAVVILLQTPAPIRHAFYETFLHLHQALAAVLLYAVYSHMKGYARQTGWLQFVIALWVIERGFRLIRILYRNIGHGGTTAEVTCLPGGAMRVKIRMARPWLFNTGQHAYVYMPFVGWWMSHPFSVAWSDEDIEDTMSEKDSLPKSTSDMITTRHENIYFLIRRQRGFTERLWKKAQAAPNGRFITHAFLEGPYNKQSLHSFGTVVLFAAGIGITHQVPHVRDLVRGYANGTVATRRICLVWIIQSPEHLEWIREWMTIILALPRRRECLRILLFVSRPRNTREIYSPSSSVQMFPGKPNIQAIVDQEVENSVGAIGVTVCGVGAVSDEVRKACRSWMGKINIDFEEESFSW